MIPILVFLPLSLGSTLGPGIFWLQFYNYENITDYDYKVTTYLSEVLKLVKKFRKARIYSALIALDMTMLYI